MSTSAKDITFVEEGADGFEIADPVVSPTATSSLQSSSFDDSSDRVVYEGTLAAGRLSKLKHFRLYESGHLKVIKDDNSASKEVDDRLVIITQGKRRNSLTFHFDSGARKKYSLTDDESQQEWINASQAIKTLEQE